MHFQPSAKLSISFRAPLLANPLVLGWEVARLCTELSSSPSPGPGAGIEGATRGFGLPFHHHLWAAPQSPRLGQRVASLVSSEARLGASSTPLLVPTGSLIQVPMSEKGKITRGRLGSLSLKKEGERQCFLFSKHLIICTRGSGGKLHLTKVRPWERSCRTWGSGPKAPSLPGWRLMLQ